MENDSLFIALDFESLGDESEVDKSSSVYLSLSAKCSEYLTKTRLKFFIFSEAVNWIINKWNNFEKSSSVNREEFLFVAIVVMIN